MDGRNLVVCLDGTDNQFCATNTNVVRMFQALEQDPTQIAYYDPGVGTIWEEGTLSQTSQKVQMVLGMAFGLGVTRNVGQAYAFLTHHYRPNDRIYVFGFSRGALEARALAALIHRCGLLQQHLSTLSPYAIRLSQTPGGDDVVREFQATFSRPAPVTFLGLWDTVTSMGNVWSPVHWPNTSFNPGVANVAHAIAIDERRAFFRQNRWRPSRGQVCTEVWFAGVHSDVGGGYPAHEGRLWAITLEWMAKHAVATGIRLDDSRWRSVMNAGEPVSVPDYASAQHESLTGVWKPLEFVPRFRNERNAQGQWEKHLMIPARYGGMNGRPRELKPGERIHRTAVERFVARPDYRPATLTRAGLDEASARAFLDTPSDEWIAPDRSGRLVTNTPEPAPHGAADDIEIVR